MGATGWRHFVPYDADIESALQRLRAQVFTDGDYLRREWNPRERKLVLPPDPYLTPEDIEGFARELAEIRALEEPTTLEKLVAWNREDGTHSIIDITRTTTETGDPGFAVAAPLPEAELVKLFGTARPSRAMVEAKAFALQKRRKRWSCTYVVVFEREEATEIFFTGFSGD